ncbi:hypothetical protein IWX49DRAFT_553321 [Phyllosticta citricarpa]
MGHVDCHETLPDQFWIFDNKISSNLTFSEVAAYLSAEILVRLGRKTGPFSRQLMYSDALRGKGKPLTVAYLYGSPAERNGDYSVPVPVLREDLIAEHNLRVNKTTGLPEPDDAKAGGGDGRITSNKRASEASNETTQSSKQPRLLSNTDTGHNVDPGTETPPDTIQKLPQTN